MAEDSFFEEVEAADSPRAWMNDKKFVLVKSIDELKQIVDKAIDAKLCALDLETNGLNTKVYEGVCHLKIAGFALSIDGETGYYAPVNHIKDNLPEQPTYDEIKRLCANCVTCYHHAKYDAECLWTIDIQVDKSDQFEDTMILAYLDDDDAAAKGKSLKDCSKRYLNMEMIKFDELFPHIKKSKIKAKDIEKNLAKLHPEEVLKYAACDAIITRLLFDKLKHNINEQPLIYKIDKALVPALRLLERNRVRIDTEYLKDLDKKVEQEMHALAEKVFKIVGYAFSFTAPREVGRALFEKLKVKGGSKTKTGEWATKKDILEKLEDNHPVVKDIIRYKQLDTLRRRYIGPLSTNVDHLSEAKFQFDACRVAGGRFACPGGKAADGYTGVNVQSTPKKRDETMPNLRSAFIARPGYKMVGIDYDGQEMRIAANLSGEENLFKIFNHPDPDERKPHRKLAQDIYHVKEPTKIQYAICKSVNFQTLYGGSGRSIAKKVDIPETEGMRMQKKFFEVNPFLKKWIVGQKKYVKKYGYVKTYFGRIRRVPFAKSNDRRMIGYAERLSINAPIQGTAGDIMRLAIINLTTLLRKKEWLDDCRLLLTIHDELIFEVREEKLDEIVPELLAVMTSIKGKNWKAILEASAEYGNSWASDTPFIIGEEARKRIEDLKAEQEVEKEAKRKEREKQKPVEEPEQKEDPKKEEQTTTDWEPKEKEENPQLSAAERKVVKEPEPDDKDTYKYVVSDPLLRCKVDEVYELIQKCPGDLKLILLDERNTRLLPRDVVIKIDPEKFYELASARGV